MRPGGVSPERRGDRVNRQFTADRPNQLWVLDLTYISTWQGLLYVAFVIDVFARCTNGATGVCPAGGS